MIEEEIKNYRGLVEVSLLISIGKGLSLRNFPGVANPLIRQRNHAKRQVKLALVDSAPVHNPGQLVSPWPRHFSRFDIH